MSKFCPREDLEWNVSILGVQLMSRQSWLLLRGAVDEQAAVEEAALRAVRPLLKNKPYEVISQRGTQG